MSQKYVPTVPSSLLDLNREDSAVDAFVKNFSDYSLKIGLILRVYDIDHKLNVNKKQVEYDVLSFIQDKDLASSPAIYPRCIMADSFGGVGDFFEFKKREPSKDILKDSSFDLKDGSMVLLLSSNGNAESGVIIGAIQHTNRKTTLTKEAGHHLEGEFNGINWQVNKDGELTITYKSKTDNKGKAQDEEAGGTFVNIDKTGQVDINTGLEGDDETYMRMDKANKDVGLKAGQHIGFTAKKNIGLNADADIRMKAAAKLMAEAEGTAMVKSGGSFDIDAGGAFTLKAPSGELSFSGNLTIKSSQINVDSPMINLGKGGTPAIILSTQFLGIGNLGMPVISQAIGGFSSSVFIGS